MARPLLVLAIVPWSITRLLRSLSCIVGCGLACIVARAEPLAAADEVRLDLPVLEAEAPVDVDTWVLKETTESLVQDQADADRQAVLGSGWKRRQPTWIQDGVTINIADYPSLDTTIATAERELQTLEWVIEEQRRTAGGRSRDREMDENLSTPERWLRLLLPREWVQWLKANREFVGGAAVLVLLLAWGSAVFARRPGSAPADAERPPPKPVRRRRRSRRSSGDGSLAARAARH